MAQFALTLDIFSNLLSLAIVLGSIAVTIVLFFRDPLRKWRFFGYLPTALVALVDPLKKTILVVRYSPEYFKKKIPPLLPQRGIYTNHVGGAVTEVLAKEVGLSMNHFDLKHIVALGELNVHKHQTRMKKFQYGVFGLSPLVVGKGYVGCICVCDESVVKKAMKPGVAVEALEFMSIEEFRATQQLQDDEYNGKRLLYHKFLGLIEEYFKN